MQPFTQTILVAQLILFAIHVIIYSVWKKRHSDYKSLIINSFIDALTLNSGLTLIAYSFGKIFDIAFLSSIDDTTLYMALLTAAFSIIAYSLDNLGLKTPYASLSENKPSYEPIIKKFSKTKKSRK